MTTISLIDPTSKKQRSNEWYTPSYIIEAARQVLGSIDLDPASCALANQTVKAAKYFTVDDDGLAQSWNVTGGGAKEALFTLIPRIPRLYRLQG